MGHDGRSSPAQWLALGERCKGWALQQLGDFATGLNLQRLEVRRWYETGAMLHATHCEIFPAERLLCHGQTAAVRTHLSAARTHRESYGEDYLAAEIDRVEASLLKSEQAPAENCRTMLGEFLKHSSSTGGPLIGIARGDEPRPAVGRTRPTERSA